MITLFQSPNLTGNSSLVEMDMPDLGKENVGSQPNSLTMTEDDDAILLFKKKKFKGDEVHSFRGQRTITDTADITRQGTSNWDNAIKSVRVSPIQFEVNSIVFRNNANDLPTVWATFDKVTVQRQVEAAINAANRFFSDEGALIELVSRSAMVISSSAHFIADWQTQTLPKNLVQKNMINLAFIEGILDSTGQLKLDTGLATPPSHKEDHVIITVRPFPNEIHRTFIHELGHYFGLDHQPTWPGNIMAQAQDAVSTDPNDANLRETQITKMHQAIWDSKKLRQKRLV